MSQPQFLYKSPNHTANLNSMRLNKWCDVIVRVNEREFHAHKVIIAANIKYFDTMLSNDFFKESKEGVITMEGFEDANIMEAFLSYAYTGEILLTVENALDLFEVANYLGEDDIKDACLKLLKNNLKKELAWRAYKIANNIDCLALKSAARTTILENFEYCSQTRDYLLFDYEHLAYIFLGARGWTVESQKTFFEGMMKWIMHDAKERKIHIENLLPSIDLAKLTADYFIDHLYANVVDVNDEHDIVKNVISCYHRNKSRQMKHMDKGPTLLAIGYHHIDTRKYGFQMLNLTKRKWFSLPKENYISNNLPRAAVLDNKLYYTTDCYTLNVFDPTIKHECTRLRVSADIPILSAMCSDKGYLYLCGGYVKEVRSNQVLRYYPMTNSIDTLAPLTTEKVGAASIFYQGCLHVLGGRSNLAIATNTVEKYDSNTNEWTALPKMCRWRKTLAVAVLDGKLYACGGYDPPSQTMSSVEVYNPLENRWQLVAEMNRPRVHFILVPHEDKLLAIGGLEERTAEVYDPRKNEWHLDQQLMEDAQMDYFWGGLMPSNCF